MVSEFVKTFFELILDKSKSFGFKTALFISIIGAIFITDCFFNVSYNFFVSNKLTNLERVNNLKSIYKNDSIQLENLYQIEHRLLKKQHYLDFISFHLLKIDFKSNTTDQKKNQIIKTKTKNRSIIRSRFWMTLTSNYLLVILLPFMLIMPIFAKDKLTGQTLLGWFASIVLICGIVLFITWIAYQIPIIFGNPVWNYILNALIHTFFIFLFAGLFTNKKTNGNKSLWLMLKRQVGSVKFYLHLTAFN